MRQTAAQRAELTAVRRALDFMLDSIGYISEVGVAESVEVMPSSLVGRVR
jgi:hypothetical protein